MYYITLDRLNQKDGYLRNIKIFVDSIYITSIEPGKRIELNLKEGGHFIQAKMWPYISKQNYVDENIISSNNGKLVTGIFYKNFFQGLSPRSLKLLTSKEINAYEVKDTPPLTFGQLQAVILSGILASSILFYDSIFVPSDNGLSKLIFLLGLGSLIGSFSVFLSRKVPNSNFAGYKPFLDIIALIVLSICTHNTLSIYLSLISIIAILAISFTIYRKRKL